MNTASVSDQIASSAVDLLLADVDTYTEWLGAACARKLVRVEHVNADPASLLTRAEGMDVPHLVALSLYPNKEAMAAAQRELTQRYIAAHPAYLAALEAELMAGV